MCHGYLLKAKLETELRSYEKTVLLWLVVMLTLLWRTPGTLYLMKILRPAKPELISISTVTIAAALRVHELVASIITDSSAYRDTLALSRKNQGILH